MIDLRSDTITQPTPQMRKAMADAVVGDDVFGEDPTVIGLQEYVAELLGKESALFVPSGVMANQIGVKSLTQTGDEIIVERGAHIFNYETAGAAVLSQVQINTLQGVRGILSARDIEEAIRPKAYYMPRTSLVCLENTHNRAGGTIYPLTTIKEIRALTRKLGIRMHLDGARLWNASVATNISPKEYSKHFDTVSVCFSKGLGAPVGSALAGSKELVEKARTFRKVFGGGMRQAGIIAAGALYAIRHHRSRLHEDHTKALRFAQIASGNRMLQIDLESVQTNIVILDTAKTGRRAPDVLRQLQKKKILLTEAGPYAVRAVMHMDVTLNQVTDAAHLLEKMSFRG